MKQLLVTAFIFFVFLNAHAARAQGQNYLDALEPFEQVFSAKLAGFNVSAHRTLQQLEDGTYELRLNARKIVARYEEKSIFRVDEQGQIFPLEHSVISKIFGIGRKEITVFDWESLQATYTKGDTIRTADIQPGFLDRALYRLLMTPDLAAGITEPTYQFVDRGRIKTYIFGIIDHEQLELVDDEVTAIKMKRINEEDDDKETLIWFAPDHNYELIKVTHTDEDGSNYFMTLKGEFD